MAAAVAISGSGAGVGQSAKVGAASGHKAQTPAAKEQQAFAAQLQANLAAGIKLQPGNFADDKDAGTGKIAAKSGTVRKTPEAAKEKTDTEDVAASPPAAQSSVNAPALAALPMPLRIAHVLNTSVVPSGKLAQSNGNASSAKASGAKGREGKAPVAGVSGAVASSATGDAEAGAIGTPVAAAGGSLRAASEGMAGVAATSGVAAVAVVTAQEAAGPSAAAGTTAPGTAGSAHRGSPATDHSFHQEMEGASGSGAAPGAGFSEARTLVTTPNVLEVGITGGAHGWLRVRAELEHTGEVTASLVASSAASADALHKELGAMSAYLKSEVVGVSSLAVTALEKGGATQGLGSQGSAGQAGAGQGGAGQASTGAGAGGSGGGMQRQASEADAKQFSWAAIANGPGGVGAGYGGQGMPAALLGAGVGGWLNVRV